MGAEAEVNGCSFDFCKLRRLVSTHAHALLSRGAIWWRVNLRQAKILKKHTKAGSAIRDIPEGQAEKVEFSPWV